MAKLTIEIDMDDPQEIWEALYRRIEQFAEEESAPGASKPGAASPVTYDVLFDPERRFGEAGDFFSVFSGQE